MIKCKWYCAYSYFGQGLILNCEKEDGHKGNHITSGKVSFPEDSATANIVNIIPRTTDYLGSESDPSI